MQPHIPIQRTGAPRRISTWLLVASIALASGAANATVVVGEVRFDGPDGFGTTQQTAIDSGIPIVSIDSLDRATGLATGQNLDDASVNIGPPGTASSDWTVTNNRGEDLDALFLVFAKPLPYTIQVNGQDQLIDYDPVDVGLRLQAGSGSVGGGGYDWVIFAVPTGGNLYYYPAVSLGSLGDGQTTASPFQVDYILDDPQTFLGADGFELGIPQWQILAVFVPIPEPSTASLVVLGVAALAAGRRRRP